MRIVILGCAASGKTTLAKRLREQTGAPVVNLDEISKTVERGTLRPPPERSQGPSKARPTSSNLTEFRKLVQQVHAQQS